MRRAGGRFNQKEKTKLSALPAEFNTMKAVRKLVVLLSVGALAAAAYATSSEQAYIETCRKDPGVPVPVAVVSPSVGPEYNGAQVRLEFVVDEKGKAAEFSITSTPDAELAKAVVEAVKLWRFQPAEIDGKPVAKKCTLPVKIVDPAVNGDRYAASN
jgi:protein TonB